MKKNVSVLLCLLILILSLPLVSSAKTIYEITTPDELSLIRNKPDAHYVLKNDIDLSGYSSWMPIGSSTEPFTGTLDGNGFEIRNLTVRVVADASDGTRPVNAALFSVVSGATIKNLGIVNASVSSHVTGSLTRNASFCHAAGFAGELFNMTTVENCYFTGSVSAQTTNNSFARASAFGCCDKSIIRNCYAVASISAKADNQNTMVGGIASWDATSIIENCYAAGSLYAQSTNSYIYCGGIVGSGSGKISNCVALTDSVTIEGRTRIFRDVICPYSTLTNNRVIDRLAADMPNKSAAVITTEESGKQSTYEDLGWDFDNVWTFSNLPVLRKKGIPRIFSLSVNGISNNSVFGTDNDISMFYTRMCSNTLNGHYCLESDQHLLSYNCDNDPTDTTAFKEKIKYSFSQTRDSDLSFFFYSGHGSSTGLVLADTADRVEIIGWDVLAKTLLDNIHGKIVVLIDACHSEGFISDGVKNLSQEERTRFSVLTSCGKDETSKPKEALKLSFFRQLPYGCFSYYLGKGIGFFDNKLKADKDKSVAVTLEELYNFISPKTKDKDMTVKKYGSDIKLYQIDPPRTTFKHVLNCPVNVNVYDNATGKLLGQIINNKIRKNTDVLKMTVVGYEKSFFTLSDADYRIELIGYDTGTMDYTVSEIDGALGEIQRVNYYDLPLTPGSSYEGVLDPETFELENYTLSSGDSIIAPAEFMPVEDIRNEQITVQAEGDGKVSASVTAVRGDYVTVQAERTVCSEFQGWYIDGTLITDHKDYRFPVISSVTMTAKFRTQHSLIPANGDPSTAIQGMTYVCTKCRSSVTRGDVNNDGIIGADDARLALRRSVDLENYPEDSLACFACDTNGDRAVGADDARRILRASVELDDPSTWV
ncbi:MAG: caspase family protein [Clostridia bacterium]|nr:caspase family protein [Clostridia bacterium]